MKKIVKGFFLMTGIVSAICMIWFIFRSSKGNYSEVAKDLQSKITEEMGEGYELIYPEEERIEIDHVIVDIDSGLYEDKNIFSDCSRLRDLIYHYVEDHPDEFSLIPAEDQDLDENISNAKGFSLQFTDAGGDKLYSGTDTVFTVTNYLELEKRYDNGFSHMSVGGPGLESYGFKLSDLQKFEGIKELYCDDIILDDTEILGKMKELRLLDWRGYPEYGEKLKYAADKYGIWYTGTSITNAE